MQIETTAGNLNAAMRAMSGVIERRNTVPVLGSVMFEKGKVTGTNLDMEVEITMPMIGKQKGAAAVDYDALSKLAAHIPDDENVSLAEKNATATVKFNGSEYRLPSYPGSDFPRFSGGFSGKEKRTLLHNVKLADALRSVRFAVSTDETRYYLNGVAFLKDPAGDGYVIAATDGHRLALKSIPFEIDGSIGKILPTCALKFLLNQRAEPKSATFDPDTLRAVFEYDGVTLRTKMIDGTYPDVFRVVPTEATDQFSVSRSSFLKTLRRVQAFLKSRHRATTKLSAVSKSEIELSGSRYDFSFSETAPSDVRAATLFECGFNVNYLIDAFTAFKNSETVTFASKSIASDPSILSGDGDDLRVVLMPMRV